MNDFFDCSVIVVGFRSGHIITRCVDSLIEGAIFAACSLQLIIVDNDPDGNWGTLDEVNKRSYPDGLPVSMKLIPSPKNGGFSYGCNLGSKYARGRWLLFLNPDAYIARDFFVQLKHDLNGILGRVQDDCPVVVGMTMVGENGRKTRNGGVLPERFAFNIKNRMIFEGGYTLMVNNHDKDGLIWPLGAGLLVSSNVFNSICGFDEKLFLTLEEPTFLKRLNRYNLLFSKARVTHEGGHSYSNKRAEYEVFYISLKYYLNCFNFTIIEVFKICITLFRVRLRILFSKSSG